jgi:hypothetical protein
MSVERLLVGAGVAGVAIAVAAGLWIAGAPSEQRALRLDAQRTVDLRQLALALDRYWREMGRLPDQLDDLVDGRRLSRLPLDPIAATPYEYAVTGTRRYRLCATFGRATPGDEAGDFWSHDAGRDCFDLDQSASRAE